jgi:DnaK suppressor protein
MGFDEEYADAGTATFERERDLSLVNNLRDLMERIDKALSKIEEGTYGLCDRCGKPIEKLRLKALPYANLCIKDKQAEERVR